MFFCALPGCCSKSSFLFSPAQVSHVFAHADFSSCIFSLRGGYHPCSSYDIGKAPTKTGLRLPHPDLIIFPHQFKGTTCISCIYLRLQQLPSCSKKKKPRLSVSLLLCFTCRYVGWSTLALETESLDSIYFEPFSFIPASAACISRV